MKLAPKPFSSGITGNRTSTWNGYLAIFSDRHSTWKHIEALIPNQCTIPTYGRKIFIVLETWERQNGQRLTADEHRSQRTWPQGTMVVLTSALRQMRHDHAALAASASLMAASDFSCSLIKNHR